MRLARIHLEEDAGKSIHDAAIAGDATHVDLNRAGVPLLEIVSEPDLRSAAEAVAYLRTLRSVLRYIDVSDADMEKGHFRCDANVSLRPRGSDALGTRTEIKNLNSFRSVEAALEAEIARQAELLDAGGARACRRRWRSIPTTGRTRVLRRKENADDYRYFPDPDLVPLVLSDAADRGGARGAARARRRALRALPARVRRSPSTTRARSPRAARSPTSSRPPWRRRHAGRAKPIANWLLRDVQRALERSRARDRARARHAARARRPRRRGRRRARLRRRARAGSLPELVERGGDPVALDPRARPRGGVGRGRDRARRRRGDRASTPPTSSACARARRRC